jgi:gamma-glutamyltranspeptidase / glutathione hydrolase
VRHASGDAFGSLAGKKRARAGNGLTPGIAAGHPATAQAGLEILVEGGTAADAAVAACLASCVAETVMTGLAGGGHALWWDAAEGRAELLDFFVAVPGLDGEARGTELVRLEVPFGTELVHYAVGIASCAVPGVPAGLGALHRRHGRLPWARLVQPAISLAADGVEMPPAHAACLAMLAPVMTMREGAGIYAPGGRLLEAGEKLEQPGLAAALALLAEEGPESMYSGSLAEALIELMADRGGLVTTADLRAYRPEWDRPVVGNHAGYRIETRAGLARVVETLAGLQPLGGLPELERVRALVAALAEMPPQGHTTNLVTVDEAGHTCVLTTSLGLGSGDFLPGYDLHLNSMLGEVDLVVGPLEPGERMDSMMAPTLALDGEGPALAIGAAGGTRLRSALVQVLTGVLDEGLDPQRAADRPRLHPVGDVVHVEPGFAASALEALEAEGKRVRRWPDVHHYFGGVSASGRAGLAADPRRSGSALRLS